MSAFTPEQLAYLEAHKDDSRVHEIYWVYSIPIAASIISTSLRLWAKRAGRNGITLDDYLIVFATICLIGQCASGLGYGPPHGMGRHVIAVAPYDLTQVRKGDYVFSHFYDIALVTVKLGILALYHRVFVVPLFRRVVLATAAFVLAWGVGITVTLALLCRPIEAYWDPKVTGKCLDLTKFTYFTNISNLITDIWIFLIPVPVIWHLQLQTKKKLLLCFIFSIGLATCIVSSIRLTVVLGHTNPDFTWYYVPLGAYSAFEPLGGILCTNLPIIWHMWRKRRPLLPGSSAFKSHPSTTATPGSSGSRRSRFARGLQSLGLSTVSEAGTDSQSRTILGTEEDGENRWMAVANPQSSEADLNKEGTNVTVTQPRPAQFWNKVERGRAPQPEMEVAGSASGGIKAEREVLQDSKRQSWRGPKSPQGLKKNVWEVRKK
ncbi:uncharacterized protein BDR25DRAFT_286022 [Lindgomyces ingoldianus]|uniref:Uncharacterized protein n=1 Tax=Lindgomyces ingoldianus TaxID=673940 RepID=A0ACB6QWJ8_9PLEO|nr:uncharacterized protein BDR25DRAFT_286022 [Lindgomyces ingoldianus]KAF2471424.1 hypothetical protein BDR25DRAFT_286022 [Lindgomyces ingoldianus]